MRCAQHAGADARELRGGGDQDDNPRYRATFASIQIATAAWAWVEQRRTGDPVFRRALVTVSCVFAWAILWYVRRIYPGVAAAGSDAALEDPGVAAQQRLFLAGLENEFGAHADPSGLAPSRRGRPARGRRAGRPVGQAVKCAFGRTPNGPIRAAP